jgi:hypothetical protein
MGNYLRKTKRHRNRRTRKRGGENEINDEWSLNAIITRPRRSHNNITPLSKQVKLIGEPYVPPQLSNARESYKSKRINRNLIENAITRPFYENDGANAAMLAAKASAIVAARAAKAEAKAAAAKARAANLGRATLNQFTRERNARKLARTPVRRSQIQNNRNTAKWVDNF